jgi:hypothetical protein
MLWLENERDHMGDSHKWEDNIKMDLKEIGYEDMGWIHVTQDTHKRWAFVKAVMHLLRVS